jgi:hypothetical protein
MTVFVAHAEADQEAAESLKAVLERRGLHVERETAERGFRPLGLGDAVVALWSKDSPFSLYRMHFEKRALDAWAEGRLVLVKLDYQFAPVGLRDLPYVDAGFEAQRELVAWPEVAKRAAEAQRPKSAAAAADDELLGGARGSGAPSPAPGGDSKPQRKREREQERPAERARGGGWGVVLGLAVAAAAGGAVATVLLVPGVGIDAWGEAIGLGPLQTTLVLGAIASAGLILAAIVALHPRPSRAKAKRASDAREPAVAEADAPAAAEAEPDAVFVSYARVDAGRVLPVCDAVKRQGQALWLDHEGIDAGESWAGEIVRAIRAVRGVAVMCSKAAFESDHVKREVFLADRYKKRLVPILLEDAPMPDDFEYFFAGVQWLKLHETPEKDRPAAMMKAIAVV